MKLAFDPTVNGFAFPNSFANHIGIPYGPFHLTTHGRCGGMAYAALDYLTNGMAVPADQEPPPDGTPLAGYLMSRLLDSYTTAEARKFAEYTVLPDEKRWFLVPGLHARTRKEYADITARLDGGQPVVLGLIKATSIASIGDNHQVLAYGYETAGDVYRLWVYDNNFPLEEIVLASYPDDPHITSTEGLGARGWFAQGYSGRVPDYLVGGTIVQERSSAARFVVHGGAAFALADGERTALGLDATPVTEVVDGSLNWYARTPADGTVVRERTSDTAHVVYGGTPFALPPVDARPGEITFAGQIFTVIDVPVDGVAALPTVPRDGTLLRELSDATAYRIDGGKRCPVASTAVLVQHGWRSQNVRVVPDGVLATLPLGPAIA